MHMVCMLPAGALFTHLSHLKEKLTTTFCTGGMLPLQAGSVPGLATPLDPFLHTELALVSHTASYDGKQT